MALDLTAFNTLKSIEVVLVGSNTSAGDTGTLLGIRLNAGATALPYKAPKNSPFTVGSWSANQLRNGNGEEGVYGVEVVNDVSIVYAGGEFVVTHAENGGGRYTHENIIAPITVYGQYKYTAPATNGYVQINTYSNGVQTNLSATPTGWTAVSGGAYTLDAVSTTSYQEYIMNINDAFIDKITISYRGAIGSSGTSEFKETQIYKGSYTLAELQAKPYVSYAPVYMLNSGDGTDNVSDRIYGQGNQIWLEKNVSRVAGFAYGDPEIDTTSLWDAPASVFTSGTYSWAGQGGNTIANVANTLEITYVDDERGAYSVLTDLNDLTQDLVVGQKYKITFDAKYTGGSAGVRGSVEISTDTNYSPVFTTALLNYTIEFTFATSMAFKLEAMAASNVVTLDNIYLYAFNIQQATAPTLEDITEFCNGWIDQEADEDMNHQLLDGNVISYTTHYIGVQGAVEDVRTALGSVAHFTDLTPTYPLSVTSTDGVLGSSVTIVEFADIDGFPDYLENIDASDVTLDADVSSVTFYPNAVVITAKDPAPAGGDELFSATVKAGMPETNHTIA